MDTQIVVETEFEAKLLKAIRAETNHKAFGKQVDLLEVYAQPNSRLSEEVIRQGGGQKDSPSSMETCQLLKARCNCFE